MPPAELPAPPLLGARHRRAPLILLVLTLATAYSFLRGQRTEPEWAGLIYYVIDYSNGLIRRALIGQIFMSAYTRAQAAQAWAMAVQVHRAVSMLMMAVLLAWIWSVFWHRTRFSPARLAWIYLVFVASQFLPTLAAINTYLDAYIFLLMILAYILAAYRREWMAACIGLVVPLLHEMSVILWIPLILMLLWRDGARGLLKPRILALCASPFAAEILLMAVESPSALATQLARAPLSAETRAAMATQQMGHRLTAEITMMVGRFATYPVRAAISIPLYAAPTAIMVALAAPCLDRRGTILLAAAGFAPLILLILGFDLSRFVVVTQFSAMASIAFMASTANAGRVAAPGPARLTRTLLSILCAALLTMPLVYGYFDTTLVVSNQVLENIPHLGPVLERFYLACGRLIA